jgi:hypothetical protein
MNPDPLPRRRPKEGRTPETPHSDICEKGLLCSLLLAPGKTMALCGQRISASSFFIPAHQILFGTICEWSKPDSPIDFIWLCNTLAACNQLAEVGGKEALDELYRFVPTAANAEHYIKIVAEKYELRQTLQICRRTIDQCLDRDADPHVILKQTEKRIEEIAHGQDGEVPNYQEVDLAKLSDEDLEPIPEFPLDALPERLRLPVEEVMRHYKVSALLPAICALLVNSAALGRGIVIKSNVRRTYANLFAIIGALSGTGKSVVFDEFVNPINEFEEEALKEFGAEHKPRAEAELRLLDQEIHELTKHRKHTRKVEITEDNRHERLCELLQEKAVLEDKLQFASRLRCVDVTSEALGILLANNGEQIAVLTDEGGLVLYNLLGRYTKGEITDDVLLCKAKTVNSTAIDRVSRPPIVLYHPCVTMLLLVQPDLLQKAFGNERLLVGGLLAKCLAADSKMELQYEDEKTLPEVDPAIMATWNQHIRSLIKMFRFAEDPCWIAVGEGVSELSRKFHNEIVDQIRGSLWDISSFATRWVERAWEIALNLHAGHYGDECYREPLSSKTFLDAIRIARFFGDRQLEVLQRQRIKALDEQRDRLKEIFAKNGEKPITLRDLDRLHGLDREQVFSTAKNHADLFGMVEKRPAHGGRKSILVFLKSNPPAGLKAPATAPRAD